MATPALARARLSAAERERSADLLRMLPKNRRSVLDIGARDCYFSRLYTAYFEEVVALDLETPSWIQNVRCVAGDVRALNFADNSFDVVFAAEVLEHVPNVERAATEILRVARHEILIGVPYMQDTRLGRATCRQCGRISPPWGHVNSFTLDRLRGLFPLPIVERSFAGVSRARTTALATLLMDLGGNPWHSVSDERCVHCGAELVRPTERTVGQRLCSAAALCLNRAQAWITPEQPTWIHLLFRKL